MKLSFKRHLSVLLSVIMITTAFIFPVSTASAITQSEINSEINRLEQLSKEKEAEIKKLKKQNAEQSKIKAAIDAQISAVNSQIELCNRKINECNSKIAANDAEIKKTNDKIDASKDAFKKRIRAIYMSGGTGGGIEVLLGAETFADYIALSQLTLNVSRRDKKMVEDMLTLIKDIEAKTAENKKLIEEQNKVKATLREKEAELDEKVGAVNKVIKTINNETSQLNSENKSLESQIKAWQNELYKMTAPSSSDSNVFKDGIFTWPVPGFTRINSGYGARWGSFHKGIDISSSGIKGKPIVAAADGTVTISKNGCSHNYGKSYSCGCGGGYGNYVAISHGTYQGSTYKTIYGHMSRTAVSVGQNVKKGQVIGYVGSTGWSTGWHLHFEIVKNGVQVNPSNYFVRVK